MKVNQKAAVSPEIVNLLCAMGAHLRAHRLEARLTHEQVAEAAGFSRQTLSRIERGDPSVAIGQIVRYASLVSAPTFAHLEDDVVETVSRRRVRRTAAERAGQEAPHA